MQSKHRYHNAMYDYIALRIDCSPCSETITDLVADSLAEIDFETFEPDDKGLTAYIRKDLYKREKVEEALIDFPIPARFHFNETLIEGEDWNKEWEQNYFQPICIDERVVIRSSFHKDAPKAPIEILIDPKMAFGTGHHATTAGMVRLLLSLDLKGKRVIDMGTGTGILSLLSKKLGAEEVSAIEIDPFALENARENGMLNKENVKWVCGDASKLEDESPADVFLANINLNVILADIDKYMSRLRPGGYLLLSGFYEKDLEEIRKAVSHYGLKEIKKNIDNGWTAVMLQL